MTPEEYQREQQRQALDVKSTEEYDNPVKPNTFYIETATNIKIIVRRVYPTVIEYSVPGMGFLYFTQIDPFLQRFQQIDSL